MTTMERKAGFATPTVTRRGVACGLVAVGAGLVASMPAGALAALPIPRPPYRSLTIDHLAIGERATARFWNRGAYDPVEIAKLCRLFRDRRTDEVYPIDLALFELIHDVMALLGVDDARPVELISGYRSPATNHALRGTNSGVARRSYHMRGQAADFRIAGVPTIAVARAAKRLDRGGYAFYRGSDFAHIDTGPPRTWGRTI